MANITGRAMVVAMGAASGAVAAGEGNGKVICLGIVYERHDSHDSAQVNSTVE